MTQWCHPNGWRHSRCFGFFFFFLVQKTTSLLCVSSSYWSDFHSHLAKLSKWRGPKPPMGKKQIRNQPSLLGGETLVCSFAKWLRKCPTGYLCSRLNVCANPHTMTVPSTWPVNIEGLPKPGEPARPCVTHMTLTLPVWQLCLAGPLAVSWLNFPSSLSPIVGKHRIPQRRRA